MDNTGYFWFSEKQKRILPKDMVVNYCKINGKIFEYSEWKNDTTKSNWEDAKFLGYGEYYGNNYTLTKEQLEEVN